MTDQAARRIADESSADAPGAANEPERPAGPATGTIEEATESPGAEAAEPGEAQATEPEQADEADGAAEETEDEEEEEDAPRGGGFRSLLIGLGVGAVVVAALAVAAIRFDVASLLVRDPTADAAVGDCLGKLPEVADGGQRTAQAHVVDCASVEAAYEVVGRMDDQTEAQVRDGQQCEPYATEGQPYYTYTKIPAGGTGYLLCLRPRSSS